MIDIHCHILPMVDDGARSIDEALQMLIAAYEDGTDEIVLTPHFAYAYDFDNPYSKIKELFEDFKYIVAQERIPIKLYLGTEFLFSSKETFLQHLDKITKMNASKYILMEFFFDVEVSEMIEAVDTVIEQGYIPIIAHPERYENVQIAIEKVAELIHHGALLQMNKGSILGRYGRSAREAVLEMLECHYIHFVGSDAHSLYKRTSLMYECYQAVRDIFGRHYAKDIFEINPRDMLEGRDIRKVRKYEEK